MDSVPDALRDRIIYQWNPDVTLIRTTPEENERLGRMLAQKVNRAQGPVAVFLPLQGVSALDSKGKEFWWPEADAALFDAIKSHIRDDIPVIGLDCNINDLQFAEAASKKLLELMD